MKKQLIATTVVASAFLVGFVLPAEYGIDITGLGEATGLNALASTTVDRKGTDFGQTLSFNIEEYDLEAETLNQPIRGLLELHDAPFMSETITLDIEDIGEIEHKFIMPENSTFVYSWKLLNPKGEGVYFEFHGHPSTEDAVNYPEDFEQAYSKGEGTGQNGTFTSPFPGYHGWYFMNLEIGPVQIELNVSGYYTEHKEMYRAIEGEVITNVDF